MAHSTVLSNVCRIAIGARQAPKGAMLGEGERS